MNLINCLQAYATTAGPQLLTASAAEAADARVPLLEVRAVHKSYEDRGHTWLMALSEVSFDARQGEFLVIVGPSGCGKSTLLRLLGGLDQPTGGQILIGGKPLVGPQQDTAIVFQRANLMPWRTVSRNVMLPLQVSGVPQAAALERSQELINLVGLSSFADSFPRQLSGGMQQRVALARALVQNPRLLLLDEPFGALDALTRERLNGELLRIWNLTRPTVVMVTHNITEAIFLADRVLVMTPRPGQVRAEFAIPFERPRQLDLTTETDFVCLAKAVRNEITE